MTTDLDQPLGWVDVLRNMTEKGYILPHLGWKDLLRFRSVCKATRRMTTEYMRGHPGLTPETGDFLKIDVSTSKSKEVGGDGDTGDPKTELLDLLEEVIEGCILPFLHWNDLLRFRRACKTTHGITTRHMRVHPELAPEIEINEEDKSFAAFLEMGIPTTKIFLNNVSGDEFYAKDEANMEEFLKQCGPLVTSLRVKKISLLLHGPEKEFPQGLSNLKNFEAGTFAVGQEQERLRLVQRNADGILRDPGPPSEVEFPARFDQLESVKIGQDFAVENILRRTNVLLKHCTRLKYASLPFCPYIDKDYIQFTPGEVDMPFEYQYCSAHAYRLIAAGILIRKEKYPDQPTLEMFDFDCYHQKTPVPVERAQRRAQMFLGLCMACAQHNVKLCNVAAIWYTPRTQIPEMASVAELGLPVVSMVNLDPSIVGLEMPNLERLEIQQTSFSPMFTEDTWRDKRPEWPMLKSLDITVDSEACGTPYFSPNGALLDIIPCLTVNTFQFCFKGIRRLALTDLRLNFAPDERVDKVPVPKMEHVVNSCPNLKKITLVNWLGTNKSLFKLWEGLPGLEDISLEYCKNVGNVTFVELDTQNPLFVKLKNLKKLSLKGLDKMPKITDLLFSVVIRHLSLTHLIITSEEPIKTVTSTGICALLNGRFAASIEKFPFTGWSLADASSEDFKNMEVQFRSYQMI